MLLIAEHMEKNMNKFDDEYIKKFQEGNKKLEDEINRLNAKLDLLIDILDDISVILKDQYG